MVVGPEITPLIWERWNGDAGDVAMNSFNHYALGAITAFLYRRVGGIAPAVPSFAEVTVRPLMDKRLGDGNLRHDTVRGRIETVWGVGADGSGWFALTLPAGVQANVQIPGAPARQVGPGRHRFASSSGEVAAG